MSEAVWDTSLMEKVAELGEQSNRYRSNMKISSTNQSISIPLKPKGTRFGGGSIEEPKQVSKMVNSVSMQKKLNNFIEKAIE